MTSNRLPDISVDWTSISTIIYPPHIAIHIPNEETELIAVVAREAHRAWTQEMSGREEL